MTVVEAWAGFLAQEDNAARYAQCSYQSGYFDLNEASANHLADLARQGIKRATAGLLWSYEYDHSPLPAVGDFWVLTDWAGQAVGVSRTSQVTIKPFLEIDATDARREGEGDGSLAYWRQTHFSYCTQECQRIGREFTESAPMVFEEFELIWQAPRASSAEDVPAVRQAIGIDIDGVLVDTIRHSAAFISDRMGKPVSAWDIIHGGSDIADIDDYFKKYGHELLGVLPPYEHAVEVISDLCVGHDVYLVSARGEYNRSVTEAWLERHGIQPMAVILTGGAGKLSICHYRDIGVFVEDSPLNARDLAEAGIQVLLLETDYNRYLSHPGVTHCQNWLDIKARLDSLLTTKTGSGSVR